MHFVKDVKEDFSKVGYTALITPIFVVLAVGAVWWILWAMLSGAEDRSSEAFQQSREAQIVSCERGNDLRRAINEHVRVLEDFLLEASDARQASSVGAGTDAQRLIDERASRRYRELVQGLEELEIADCEEVIPKYNDIQER